MKFLKRLHAFLYLAFHLAVVMARRLFRQGSSQGIQFLKDYAPDHLLPNTGEERALLFAFSRCIACGLCDSECRVFWPPSFWPHLSRSMPDFIGSVSLDPEGCEACAGCEAICPEKVPLKKIVLYIQRKNDEIKTLLEEHSSGC